MWDLGEYWDDRNSGEYRKWGIHASTGNVRSGRVPGMGEILTSIRKGRIRVPKMWDLGEYREGKIWVSTGKGRIRESTRNGESG